MKDYKQILQYGQAAIDSVKRVTEETISPATQEKIALEIAKHLDEALRGVERILLNHGLRMDTKVKNEMREMQTDIKSLLQTLVRRWKL